MTKQVTIKDVAEKAGVSTATVSHVINDTRFVNETTKQEVNKAMLELGYRPNFIARSLRSGKTKSIGLIVPDMSNPFFAEISRKIEDLGYKKGYSVILGNSDNSPEKQANYINTLLAKQIDGFIFISSDGDIQDLITLSNSNIPLVVADRFVPFGIADVVMIDNEKAGYDATKYLLELGHKCIACITGPHNISPSMMRVEGYKKALKEAGISSNDKLIVPGDFSYQSGMLTMKMLLKTDCFPSAVFALNDLMAIGAMTAARDAGLIVPDDISIVGFDDIEISSAVTPKLTTVAQPITELANNIIDLLLEQINNKRLGEYKNIVLAAKLIKRESVSRLEKK